jgi:hypothetical protein
MRKNPNGGGVKSSAISDRCAAGGTACAEG